MPHFGVWELVGLVVILFAVLAGAYNLFLRFSAPIGEFKNQTELYRAVCVIGPRSAVPPARDAARLLIVDGKSGEFEQAVYRSDDPTGWASVPNRASKPSEVRFLGCLTRTIQAVGQYTGGCPAQKEVVAIRVVDLLTRSEQRQTFTGEEPPQVIRGSNCAPGTTSHEPEQVNAWLSQATSVK